MRPLVIVLLLLSAPAAAQETVPFAWSEAHRTAAARISDGLVAVQIGAETVHNFRAPDRWRALGCQALREGLSLGVAAVVKRGVHRERPDGSDRASFFSGHTTQAAVHSGWDFRVSVPIVIGVGYLRSAADKHYVSDVLVGAAVGTASRFICRSAP